MKKALKISGIVLLAALVIIQFAPRNKNANTEVSSTDIREGYMLPNNIVNMLETACYDCHSNNTHYPWYSAIQPIRWWMDGHVEHGKEELNFSEFMTYSEKRRDHKLEEIAEEVEEGHMPIASYTWMHGEAKWSKEEAKAFIGFFESLRNGVTDEE